VPLDKHDNPLTEHYWEVELNGMMFKPNLCNLNTIHEKDIIDQFGVPYKKGDYKDHIDFIWFLFHENLKTAIFMLNMEMAYKLVANSFSIIWI
jgi:hypothetical protein